MTDWQPTNELRLVERLGKQVAEDCYQTEKVLQQRWKKKIFDEWQYQRVFKNYEYEWRDVPTVTED